MSGIYNTNYSAIEESTQQNHRSNIIDIVENCEIIKKKKNSSAINSFLQWVDQYKRKSE